MRVGNDGERTRRTGSGGGRAAQRPPRTGTAGWSRQECQGKKQRWNGASGTREAVGSSGSGEKRQRQPRKGATGTEGGAPEATEHPGRVNQQAGEKHGNRTGTSGEEAHPDAALLWIHVHLRDPTAVAHLSHVFAP